MPNYPAEEIRTTGSISRSMLFGCWRGSTYRRRAFSQRTLLLQHLSYDIPGARIFFLWIRRQSFLQQECCRLCRMCKKSSGINIATSYTFLLLLEGDLHVSLLKILLHNSQNISSQYPGFSGVDYLFYYITPTEFTVMQNHPRNYILSQV